MPAQNAPSTPKKGGIPDTSGAQAVILNHRLGFDAWLAAVKAKDASTSDAAYCALTRAESEASETYESSLNAVFNYVPGSLYEASLIASHLIVHVELNHFDKDDLIHFLHSLAIAPVDVAAPRSEAA